MRRIWGIKCIVVLLMSLTYIFLPSESIGEAAPISDSKIKTVFVLDVSNSMGINDAERISQEAMKMFIDMTSNDGNKVGIVGFTDKVLHKKDIVTISSSKDKVDLKNFIDGLTRGPFTDLSEGLHEALQMMQANQTTGYNPLIILLADGNNELSSSSSKTVSQADEDVQTAVQMAIKQNYPIYVIGLNTNGQLNEELLKNIAVETGGDFFTTASANDLPHILSEIYADHSHLKMMEVLPTGEEADTKNFSISIPNSNIKEANMIITSNEFSEVTLLNPDQKIVEPSKNMIVSKSKDYTMVKILHPSKGEWQLTLKGVKGEELAVKLLFNYDLELKAEPLPSTTFKTGDTIDITAYFESGGEKIDGGELYTGSSKAMLLVTEKGNPEEIEIPLRVTENSFTGSFKIESSNVEEIKVRVESNSFYRESEPIQIQVEKSIIAPAAPKTEAQPVVEESDPISLNWLLPVLVGVGAVLLLILTILMIRRKKEEKRRETAHLEIVNQRVNKILNEKEEVVD